MADPGVRLLCIRTAVLVGAIGVGSTELLGATVGLEGWSVAAVWLATVIGLCTFACRRWPICRRPDFPRLQEAPAVWLATGALLVLVALIALVALAAAPNNWDSQTYHLTKVEHWVAQGSVEFFPTSNRRQIAFPPGAEYLSLHLRLLSGGDAFANLVQFCGLLTCVAATSRIAAQLGGNRIAQLLTALLVASAPMAVLQASSTQTDLIAAAWVAALATFALDSMSRASTWPEVMFLGLATGLIAVTKTTGLLAGLPLLVLWLVAQLRASSTRQVIVRAISVAVISAVLVGPFLGRMVATYGHPLGDQSIRNGISMERHDPAAVLVNGMRIGTTVLDSRFESVTQAFEFVTESVADLMSVELNDPAITYGSAKFPSRTLLDEDFAAMPVVGLLALAAFVMALDRPAFMARRRRLLRAYAGVAGFAWVAHAATVKWQPWGNRLLLYLLILTLPLAGLFLEATIASRHRFLRVLAVGIVCASFWSGIDAVTHGSPRPLLGERSVLLTSDMEQRFFKRPQQLIEYRRVAAAVQATGEDRVGLVAGGNTWEYPLWVLLPGKEFAAVYSTVPLRALPVSSVNVIVCIEAPEACSKVVPADWDIDQLAPEVAVARRN